MKLKDKSQELSHYISYTSAHEQVFELLLDGLSSSIFNFSVLLIGIMIVVSLLETLYLRKYLINRKNI